MEEKEQMTCWSRTRYERTQHGPTMWHHKCLDPEGRKDLCPNAGPASCRRFKYEPGSDEKEARDAG